MIRTDLTKDEIISAIRGLDIKSFPTSDLNFLSGLLKMKEKQVEEEIRTRKARGEISKWIAKNRGCSSVFAFIL